MGIHVGVNGTPKEVVGVYVGVNGTPKECSDIYVGVNGTPKSCYSGVKPGETIFTSSSTFTVPKGVKKIDVFCVGGGGHGNAANFADWYGGGGGGYTRTVLGASVTPGQEIPIVVGSAASASSVGEICNANGGSNGASGGGNGGSGGGSAYFGIGGKDGGNGGATGWRLGGKGQGRTTRYFGESTGTLYSTGGNSADYGDASRYDSYIAPQPNTGDGGHKGSRNAGGSGICIIRWSDQKS